ncbi:MAG TPA: dipicolinate synthase subunit DpsA [Candidatus Egerieisoma faecipullorum]|uniref:Dipicolinate synthase subunit DpsA n=1 Tax=Candidatus Egerieisoma faecipullorum TaxID=2840963 RepID=A0A9D1I6Z0_9CLOT|nr:dipicolinate synthase subunit DpsA [Candidatus Egerieisoma faecipullorum]
MDAQKTYRFSIIGGDMRNVKLSELLSEDGHEVHTFALDNTGKISQRCSDLREAFALSDIAVGPMPFTSGDGTYLNAPFHPEKIEIAKIADVIRESSFGGLLIGGRIPLALSGVGAVSADLLQRDDLAVLNSVPTAEGALQIAMEELPYTIRGLRTVVCGMGRVGSTLARLMQRVGADVTVAARSSRDFAICEAEGLKSCTYSHLRRILPEALLVYNTVPALIFDRELLDCMNREALLIDLASMPGGTDFEYAAKRRIRTIHALSLPGKVAPAGAAQIIQKVIYNILHEKNM